MGARPAEAGTLGRCRSTRGVGWIRRSPRRCSSRAGCCTRTPSSACCSAASASGILGLAASVLAGFGIANEKRWGYFLAVVLTGLEVLLYVVAAGGIIDAISSAVLIPLAFTVALFALLLHPQSRDYQRIWFK